jgi:CXXX repeat radical SAM target protein
MYKDNKEIQSRREFFKTTKKMVLPFLGTMALLKRQIIAASHTNRTGYDCNGTCENTCTGTATGGCMSCSNHCVGTCEKTCTGSCAGCCYGSCGCGCMSCKGTCQGVAEKMVWDCSNCSTRKKNNL